MAAEPLRTAAGEVLGLRWSDIDLQAKTLTVNQGRVLVDCKVRIEPPKSRNGKRTLPLDAALITALNALRMRTSGESQAAGAAYGAGLADLDWYTPGDLPSLPIAANCGTAGRFCQESKIGVADAEGALDRFWPPRSLPEREPNLLVLSVAASSPVPLL